MIRFRFIDNRQRQRKFIRNKTINPIHDTYIVIFVLEVETTLQKHYIQNIKNSKMNDNLSQARIGCSKIDENLKRKQLSLNYGRSQFVIVGSDKYRKEVLNQIEKEPMMMGNVGLVILRKKNYVNRQG